MSRAIQDTNMLWRISATLLVTAVLTGCGSSNQAPAARYTDRCQSPQAAPLKTHVHANGLQLSVSEVCKVTTTPSGFSVAQPDGFRYPFRISIRLLETEPPKAAKGARVHYLGSRRFLWYSATNQEAGMGDPEWDVTAFERVGNHWVEYAENKQDEWQPGELWQVARRLRYLPSS